jgi:4'-phosphopantetheinyl transferase
MSVRFASLDLDPQELARRAASLTPAELARAERLRRPIDRDRAIARRAILREMVAAELGMEAADVPLTTSPSGHPELAGDLPVDISVSSSGGMGAFAVGPRYERVGVDIEAVDRPELDTIDPALFLDAEEIAMLPPPGPERRQALLTAWTLKEALAKALGVGLALPLRDLHIGSVSDPRPLLRGDWRMLQAEGLRVATVEDAPPGYAAAIAAVGGAS